MELWLLIGILKFPHLGAKKRVPHKVSDMLNGSNLSFLFGYASFHSTVDLRFVVEFANIHLTGTLC